MDIKQKSFEVEADNLCARFYQHTGWELNLPKDFGYMAAGAGKSHAYSSAWSEYGWVPHTEATHYEILILGKRVLGKCPGGLHEALQALEELGIPRESVRMDSSGKAIAPLEWYQRFKSDCKCLPE